MKVCQQLFWPMLGTLVIGLCVATYFTAEPGWVSEVEFSPDTLTFRSRGYFCFRWIGAISEWSAPLAERVREYDDGKVLPQSPHRWQFVHGDKWRTRGWMGDGKPAYRLFRDESWVEWTDKNPELAKRFWPRIIHLIRQEQQAQLPIVLMYARDAKTLDDIDLAFAEAEKE